MPGERLHLPYGFIAELDPEAPTGDAPSGAFAEDAASFRGRLLDPSGSPIAIGELPLASFHTLRALLRRLGQIAELPVRLACDNCEHAFEVRPCSTLELGPYRDGELDDPELDQPFDFEGAHDAGALGTVRLEPRTLAQALALHQALSRPRDLRVTSRIVQAMGIAALGDETDARRIARALSAADDDDFDAVSGTFEEAHYPRRLLTAHKCPECGVVAWVMAPSPRELSSAPAPGMSLAPDAGFPDIDAFERLVKEEADVAYRELGVRNVDLLVIEGPAEHDDAGEPLLGCYRSADPHALPPEPHEIRLFYRTFANIWRDEGEYDVRAEVAETLRHELEHHLAHLAGVDPIDELEHAEIDREVARRVGRGEARRRALDELVRDVAEFARRTWVVWLVALIATLLTLVAER